VCKGEGEEGREGGREDVPFEGEDEELGVMLVVEGGVGEGKGGREGGRPPNGR
jgi:hypothetical protein